MAPLKLTYASCKYDRIEALRSGEVQVEGVDLNVIVFPSGRQIFDRMIGGKEFDASELSASEFIAHAGRGNSPFVAIPVFPSRVFRHAYIFVNRRAGIRTPKDLEGRRVGLPLYTQTASIWLRGHLQHQFGVDLRTIHWVQGLRENPLDGVEPLYRLRRGQAHRAGASALRRLARRHAAVAAGRDRGNRRSVRRRSVPLRHRAEPADIGSAGAIHGRAAFHRGTDSDREAVRAAIGCERDVKNTSPRTRGEGDAGLTSYP